MAKIKLQAGAELDLLNKDELRHEMGRFLADWMVEAARGPRSVRFSALGAVTSAGTLTLGGNTSTLTSGRLGPDESMVWSVKRWCISGLVGNGDTLSAYVNNDGPNSLIMSGVSGFNNFGSDSLVLQGGDRLLFTGAELLTAAGTQVGVSGQAWELPATLMWRLL